MIKCAWALGLLLVAGCVSGQSVTPATLQATPLFNGRDLDGWTAHYFGAPADARPASSMFCVEGEVIHLYCAEADGATVSQGFIQSDAEFGDVVLTLEYRWGARKFPPRAELPRDSGLMYFNYDIPPGNWPRTLESQIQENDTGDVWALSVQADTTVDPASNRYAANGEARTIGAYNAGRNVPHGRMSEVEGWNRVEVYLRGDASVHVINGHVTNRLSNIRQWDGQAWVRLDRGRISIQAEAAEMFIRNVSVRPLTEAERRGESP